MKEAMAPARKKTVSPPPSTLHPPYLQMITKAITSLKDRTGSSQPAIAKFMEEKHHKGLPTNFRKILSAQLKKLVKSEKLVKINNSYKVSASEKVKMVSDTIKGSQKKSDLKKGVKAKSNVSPKKGEKRKRLSEVKTPEALKKKKSMADKSSKKVVTNGKMKRLSQVKTPEGLNKKRASRR
ncbi:histone H1-like [Cornus florida]|uniref:histone H1-like n=1 Tax=Cornus florida TaxID=4283 RepID=UPI00289EECB1|nr:histone H1-like [Cornus florida]